MSLIKTCSDFGSIDSPGAARTLSAPLRDLLAD